MKRIFTALIIILFALSFVSIIHADECDLGCTNRCDKSCSTKCDKDCSISCDRNCSNRCHQKIPGAKQQCLAKCVSEEDACMTGCVAKERVVCMTKCTGNEKVACMTKCTGEENDCKRKKEELANKNNYIAYVVSNSPGGCSVIITNNKTGKTGNAANKNKDLLNSDCATVFINAFNAAGIKCHGTLTPGEIMIDKFSDWKVEHKGTSFIKKLASPR